jgi:hypothetical protein
LVGRDGTPALLDERTEVDRRHVIDVPPLAGEAQQVVDQRIHPGERVVKLVKMRAVTLLPGEGEAAVGHLEWIPEVVGDDAREGVEALVLPLEFPLPLFQERDVPEHDQFPSLPVALRVNRRDVEVKDPLVGCDRIRVGLDRTRQCWRRVRERGRVHGHELRGGRVQRDDVTADIPDDDGVVHFPKSRKS